MTEMSKDRALPAGELRLADGAMEVPVPYPGPEYVCPNCERKIPTRKQQNMAKPAKYAHALNDVMKCCWCSFIFSYRSTMYILRE